MKTIPIGLASAPLTTHTLHPTLHSVFGEFFGDVIYDGTWVGKDSFIPNVDGIRLDLIEGLKEAGVAAIRWPGGCCADHYHWMDGIGNERRRRMPFNEVNNFDMSFGTDEFLHLCRLVGAEPVLTANTATGTPEEFAAWVEYCNGDADTKYGALRAANGHPEPYRVKNWGIGNTDENVWWIAYADPLNYARDFRRFKTAVMGSWKEVRFIGLGLSLRHETPDWVEPYLDYITGGGRARGADFLSVHHYIGGMKARYRLCGDAVDYDETAYRFTLDSLSAYQADIDYHRKAIAEHTSPKFPVRISFDEWGLWHPEATNANRVRQRQTMRDAIFAACALHLFYRNSDIVTFAMETQYVNLLQSLFETRGAQFVRTPTFYVFKLFREHLGRRLLPVSLPDGEKDLDCVASHDDRGTVLTLVNRSLHEPLTVVLPADLPLAGASLDCIAPADVHCQNVFDAPEEIFDRPAALFGRTIALPPHSISRLVCPAPPAADRA